MNEVGVQLSLSLSLSLRKLQTSPSLKLEGMGIDTKHDFAIVSLATKDLRLD
jgi:hypothetical protein